jgi:hypothetical protein
MKQQRIFAGSIVALFSCLAACANPGVVEVAPDQYMLARHDPGGMVGNTAALKARIIKDANAFAAAKGKRAVPVPLDQLPGWPTCDPLLVEYHFRLVDPAQLTTPPRSN